MSRSDVLVDADWVQAHLDDPKVVIVEVDEDTVGVREEPHQERRPDRLDAGPPGPGPP